MYALLWFFLLLLLVFALLVDFGCIYIAVRLSSSCVARSSLKIFLPSSIYETGFKN